MLKKIKDKRSIININTDIFKTISTAYKVYITYFSIKVIKNNCPNLCTIESIVIYVVTMKREGAIFEI